MGTLNVSPLGANIDIRQIQRRLRHTSVRTTENSYITNNPLLAEEAHDLHMERNGRNGNDPARNKVSRNSNTSQPPQTMTGEYMAEADAIRTLSHFNIKPVSLRQYASEKGCLKEEDGKNIYHTSLINELVNSYITREEAMKNRGYTSLSGFSYMLESKGISKVTIGRTILLKALDILRLPK